MATQAHLPAQNRKLKRRITDLEAPNKAFRERVVTLKKELGEARSKLLAQKRARKRQAAPLAQG